MKRFSYKDLFSSLKVTAFVLVLTVGVFLIKISSVKAADYPELVSVASDGTQGNSVSNYPAISADGRFVAFPSSASNLVSGDTNFSTDVFVHDRQTDTTERVSVASDGSETNLKSEDLLSISADGRFVVFGSEASNLVSGDTNFSTDVFVRDRQTDTTERVSVASDGTQGNLDSKIPSISADGRFIVFLSTASNLVSGDTNGTWDVFMHDRQTGTTEQVSISSSGAQANRNSDRPFISADGRFVSFGSDASNLIPGDTNNTSDLFVHDRQTGTTERVSISSSGAQANGQSDYPYISTDGRFITFISIASNLISGDTNSKWDTFVHDRQTGTTERVSISSSGAQANSDSNAPSISADGRFVLFASTASNLVSDDTNGASDVFIHDRQTGTTERISTTYNGAQANSDSNVQGVSITPSGDFVAFFSSASNLIQGDTNGNTDVFVTHYPLLNLPPNQPPTVDAGGPYPVSEGSSVQVTATGNDPENGSLIYAWDLDNNGSYETPGQSVNFSAANLDGPYTKTIAILVTDNGNLSATDEAIVNVLNVAPTVGAITTTVDPVQVNTSINASASFTDPGTPDIHTAIWDWGDGTTNGTVTESNGSGSVSDSHGYTAAGVYTVKLTVTDDDNDFGESVFQYVVVYDPAAGYVTGAGTITSPPGAYTLNPLLTGKAVFGFVSRYQNGASVPTGNTQFRFTTAQFTFSSTSYDWLVVGGPKAQYKGSGTINGNGDYGFILSSIDGQVNGGGGTDKFRIKVYEKLTNVVVYDNQTGASDTSDPSTAIDSGSIMIHN